MRLPELLPDMIAKYQITQNHVFDIYGENQFEGQL